MSKSVDELASDIMVAWLHAIGSTNCSESSTPSIEAQKILFDQDTVVGFYEKIYKAIFMVKKHPAD